MSHLLRDGGSIKLNLKIELNYYYSMLAKREQRKVKRYNNHYTGNLI